MTRALGLAGLTKAEQTRAAIVDAALVMAQQGGLESPTIGTVGGRTGLSKSGVFSRVGRASNCRSPRLARRRR